jgi:hypothetical protein
MEMYYKIRAVIDGCTTVSQLTVAVRYVYLARHGNHISHASALAHLARIRRKEYTL